MKIKNTTPPYRAFSVLMLFALVLAQVFLPLNSVNADQITTRSLELQTSDTGVGGSTPGGVVDHLFTFTLPNTGTAALGSLKFQYCTQPADVGAATCVAPTGLDSSTATLGSSSGVTGLTIQHTAANEFYLTRSPGGTVTPAANTVVTVLIKNIENPDEVGEPNYTFFTRIGSYTTLDATGTATDLGAVAASTADPVIVSGTMPESLVFCTGATVGVTATVPDCSTATAATVNYNQLFSPTATAMATSQMAASTNAGFGYAITVNGPTLTSGTNTIAAIGAPSASTPGIAQFGMNLVANTLLAASGFTDDVNDPSKDPAPLANTTNYKGQPATDYGTVDQFKYIDGDVVANSYNGYVPGTNTAATDAQIFTVSYIANVPGSQPAGTYTSTLTYVCTPTY